MTASSARRRVGVIGAGRMARRHAAALVGLGHPTLIWSRDAGRVAELAAEVGAEPSPSLDALLAGVELVVVAAPTDQHRALVERAAAAGAHVLCEKPLALTATDAEAMAAACARAGVRLFPGHAVRFMPIHGAAHQQVLAGAVGTLRALTLLRACPPPDWAGWYADPHRSGGVVLDLMIHDLDVAHWIAGEVIGLTARLVDVGAAPGAYATATLEHRGGVVSTVTASWGHRDRPFRSSVLVTGDDRALDDDWFADLVGPGPHAGAHTSQLADVLEALDTGRPARTETADGVAAVRLAETVLNAARSTGSPPAPIGS